jgi:hypothetical protein
VGTPEGWERALLYLDAAQSFWREWIISYDSSHQYTLGQAAVSGTRNSWEKMRMAARMRYARLLTLARRGERRTEQAPIWWFACGAGVGLLFLMLGNAGRISRVIQQWRLRAHPERSPEQAAAMWYERMADYLARRGWKKSPTQTAQEFVHVIENEPLRTRVGHFTDAYESARFGNSSDDAQRLPELYEEVESAMRK